MGGENLSNTIRHDKPGAAVQDPSRPHAYGDDEFVVFRFFNQLPISQMALLDSHPHLFQDRHDTLDGDGRQDQRVLGDLDDRPVAQPEQAAR